MVLLFFSQDVVVNQLKIQLDKGVLTLNNIIFRVIRLPGDWLIKELWNMMIMQTAIIMCLVKWSSPGSKFRPRHRPIYQVFELIKPFNWLYCLTASREMITAIPLSLYFLTPKSFTDIDFELKTLSSWAW